MLPKAEGEEDDLEDDLEALEDFEGFDDEGSESGSSDSD
jgi:hypothetical protein